MDFNEIVNYELVVGNSVWRFVLLLIVVIVSLAIGRILQFVITGYANRRKQKHTESVLVIFMEALSKPINVAVITLGIYLCRLCLVFDDVATKDMIEGIQNNIHLGWTKVVQALIGITFAYALFHLVDVIEYYLNKVVSRTQTKLDDMLVPIVRKSLRITIAIVAILIIAENVFGADNIKSLILSAGVGGIAIALAAKDTIANFFGSLTIFADRPFQIDELVKISGHTGAIEEVGFRSTKMRTLYGHQITIPNSTIVNSDVENIGRRPFIRRTTEITITYDSGFDKTQKAVEIIKDVLGRVEEINSDPEKMPRVYFSEFGSCSLNIYVTYWVKPADYWMFQEVNERINFEILKRFDDAGIEFAFPTQTLYVKKEEN